MQLSKRKSKIISELLKTNDYLTSQYFADVLGVSSRTIRNDMKELNDCFLDMNIFIDSIVGKGYRIDKTNKEKINKLINLNQGYIIPILPKSREDYIVKQLLINPNGLSLHKLSNDLFVSESTLNRDIDNINKGFKNHNLSIKRKKRSTYTIIGNETDIRQVYNNYFDNINVLKDLPKNAFNNLMKVVRNKIKKIFISKQIYISGDVFNYLIIFITVVIFRVKNGYKLNEYSIKNINNDEIITSILDIVISDIELNQFDKEYIIDFCTKIFDKNTKSNLLNEGIKNGLIKTSQTFDYQFSSQLLIDLENAINKFVKIKSNNYSLKTIRREYPLAFEMATYFYNLFNLEYSFEVNDNLLIDIVLAFACDMERDMLKKENKKRNVAVICNSKELVNKLIEVKIKRYFPAFNIIGFFPLYMYEKAIDLRPDIIISTIMIDAGDIPLIVIDPLFKDYDVIKINTVISQLEHRENNAYDFLNIFREDIFAKDIDANNQYDVINYLFKLLKKKYKVNDSFLQNVFDRETISSTYIGNMVAIPHAIGSDIGENIVAIGITKKPINWNGAKVQLVFLINIQNAKEGNVKQIFNSFFNVISSQRKVERLIKSKNYYEFIKTINK